MVKVEDVVVVEGGGGGGGGTFSFCNGSSDRKRGRNATRNKEVLCAAAAAHLANNARWWVPLMDPIPVGDAVRGRLLKSTSTSAPEWWATLLELFHRLSMDMSWHLQQQIVDGNSKKGRITSSVQHTDTNPAGSATGRPFFFLFFFSNENVNEQQLALWRESDYHSSDILTATLSLGLARHGPPVSSSSSCRFVFVFFLLSIRNQHLTFTFGRMKVAPREAAPSPSLVVDYRPHKAPPERAPLTKSSGWIRWKPALITFLAEIRLATRRRSTPQKISLAKCKKRGRARKKCTGVHRLSTCTETAAPIRSPLNSARLPPFRQPPHLQPAPNWRTLLHKLRVCVCVCVSQVGSRRFCWVSASFFFLWFFFFRRIVATRFR